MLGSNVTLGVCGDAVDNAAGLVAVDGTTEDESG